jgi:serine/threonine protein kinase
LTGRYQPLRFLGRGGMAEVYLGVALGEAGFRKPVVIKRVLPELAHDTRVLTMFADEARLAQHLSHQNVVQVYHAGKSAQGLFLAMEFVNGWNLETVLGAAQQAQRPFPPALAAYVIAQVHAGLAHAYRRTHEGKPVVIAHRDVSPSNVLLSAEGEVKLSDFGIARGSHLHSLTEPGTFKGKLAYAAPEALRGDAVSSAADQFSLGVVLHELLTLRHPFWNGSNLGQYAARMEKGFVPLPDAPLSPELEALLARMLAPEPNARFSTAELGEALAQIRGGTADALVTWLGGLALPPPPLPAFAGVEALPSVPEAGVPSLEDDSPVASGLGPSSAEAWFEQLGEGDEPLIEGPALRADGHVQGWTPAHPVASIGDEPLAKTVVRAPPAPMPVEDEPLELAERPRPGSEPVLFGETVPRGPLRLGRWLAIALVLVVAAVAFVNRSALMALLDQRAGTNQPVLLVTSEPSGARVLIDGQPVGNTPLAIANRWGGEVELRVEQAGYKPYRHRLVGGAAAEVHAKLRK